jgi:hypothetical protein
MRPRREYAYAAVAMMSGAAWFAVAALCDSVRGEYIGGTMPLATRGAFTLFLLSGVATGVIVSYGFRRAFHRARLPWELLLPLATIPFGVSVFAVLVWLTRFALGYRVPSVLPGEELGIIVMGYLFYALVSLLTPVLYVLALLNQGIMHLILVRGVEQ